MPKLRTAMAMPLRDLAGVAEAGVLMLAARLLVRFVPLRRWQGQLGGDAPELNEHQRAEAARIAVLVGRAVRNAPISLICLPQALAARWMLARRGVASRLSLGTRRGADGSPEFHAWLMAGDVWVTGRFDGGDYATFTTSGSLPEI